MSQHTQDPGLRAALVSKIAEARRYADREGFVLSTVCLSHEATDLVLAALSATPAHAPGKAGDREGLAQTLFRSHSGAPMIEWGRLWETAKDGYRGMADAAVAALAPSPTGNEAPRGEGSEALRLLIEKEVREIRLWAQSHESLETASDLDTVADNLTAALADAPPPPVSTEPDSRAGAEREEIIGRLNRLAKDAWDGSAGDWIEQAVFAMSAASRYLAALHPSPPTASGAAAPVGEDAK